MNPIFSKFENIFADFSGALLFGYFFIIISQKLQHRGSSSEGKLFSLVLCIIDIHKTGHGLKSGNPRVYFDTDGGLKGGGVKPLPPLLLPGSHLPVFYIPRGYPIKILCGIN